MALGAIVHKPYRASPGYSGDCTIRSTLLTGVELPNDVVEIHSSIFLLLMISAWSLPAKVAFWPHSNSAGKKISLHLATEVARRAKAMQDAAG
jgi:hypothetical protein